MIFPFVVMAVIILVLAWVALAYWIANLLLYAQRQPLLRTPSDVDLPYEDITFPSKDRLSLRGWWIPSTESLHSMRHAPVVILLHPLFGNRHGLTRSKEKWPFLHEYELDLLQIAKTFHDAGYAVLLFDFRSHGESERGLCTGGFTEDQDVIGAVDYVFQRVTMVNSAEKPMVGIVGFGLGASASFAAVGREKGGAETLYVLSGDSEGGSGFVVIRPPNVKCLRFLVAIQPTSLAVGLQSYLRQNFSFLRWVLVPLITAFYEWRSGYPMTVTPLFRFSREVNVPVLYTMPTAGMWAGLGEAQAIYNTLPEPKQTWWLDDRSELFDIYQYVETHPLPMLEFAAHHICGKVCQRNAV